MSEINLTPEQIAMLQQRGAVDPRVAAAMRQRALGPPVLQGVPMQVQAPRLAAHMLAPAPQAAPQAQQPAATVRPVRPGQTPRTTHHSLNDAIFASLAAKAQRLDPGIPVTLQMPLKASYVPKDVRDRAAGGGRAIIGWDPAKLDDDEFVMAVRYVERNLDNMSPEAQQQAFGAFAAVVQNRPGLRKKLQAAAAESEHGSE